MSDKLIPYRIRGQWGYCTDEKEIVIPCQFDLTEPFNEERAVVFKGEFWAVINKKGDILTEFQYEGIRDFENGFAAFKKNGKWGFFNIRGEEQIPPIYDGVLSFSDNRAAIKLNDKFGFIDTAGNQITEFNYQDCDSFIGGYASVMEGECHGVIDINGIKVVPCISRIPVEFSEGLAVISYIDPDAPLNKTAQRFKDFDPSNLTGYEKHGKIIFEDRHGNVYDREQNNLASLNHRCGYVNNQGQTVIGFNYDMAFPFKEGLACVCVDSKYGFINKKGEWVVKPTFEDARDFKEGVARVNKEGKWGYLKKNGELLIDFIYTYAFDFNEGLAKIKKEVHNNRYVSDITGLVNKEGEEYFYVSYFSEGYQNISYCSFVDLEENEDACYFDVHHDHDKIKNGFIVFGDQVTYEMYYSQFKFTRFHFLEDCIEAHPFKNGLAKLVFRKKGEIFFGYMDYSFKQYWEDWEKF